MKRSSALALLFLSFLALPIASCATPSSESVSLQVDFALTGKDSLMKNLQEKFPEISFSFDVYRGRNPDSYIIQRLEKEDASDLIFAPFVPSTALQKEKLLDLSTSSFSGAFDTTTWNDYGQNGSIYLLPAPLNARFIAYNKTLFAERGWTIPTTFDEMVSLCQAIRSYDINLIPLSLSGANINVDFFLLLVLAQSKNLFVSGGNDWLSSYLAGSGSCAAGLSDAVSMLQKLIAAKAFDLEDRDHWYGDVYSSFVKQRRSAMLVVWNGQNDLDRLISNSTGDEFGAFPFLGSQATNRVLGIESSFSFGVAKKLANPGQEKKKAAALKVVEYLSSKEGMVASEGGATTGYFPLSGVNNEAASPFFQEVFALGKNSSQSRPLLASFQDVAYEAGNALREALFSLGDISSLPKSIDGWHQTVLKQDVSGFYGEFAGDFSKEETAQLMANILQDSAYGDVSVVSLGGNKDGVSNEFGSSWGKVYKGIVKASEINIPVPKDGSILTVLLTGAQLKFLLSLGKKIITSGKSVSFPLYASGITYSLENGTLDSVLVGGIPLDEAKSYKLAYVGVGSLASSLKEVFDHYPNPDASNISNPNGLPYVENDTRIAFLNYYSGYLRNHRPIELPSVQTPATSF
jgi:raffinose/stachyose/melibiose transport system substrate-binding protein